MPADRTIKARDIVGDIRSGMTDAQLMGKYQLSARGLRSLFKQIVDAGAMRGVEVYGRSSQDSDAVDLEDARGQRRSLVHFRLPVFEQSRSHIRGSVEDISTSGLKARGLIPGAQQTTILVIPADTVFMIEQVVLEAVCRWCDQEPSGVWRAGFEIVRVLQGQLNDLLLMVQTFPFSDPAAPKEAEALDTDEDQTETVDLASIYSRDVTLSGSFNLRGIKQTWFGRLLQALPIPALVVDQYMTVSFLNDAWGTIAPDYRAVRGTPFCEIFPDPSVAQDAGTVAESVFETRKHCIFQAVMEIQGQRLWGRIHLRPIRMGTNRSLLVLVEDLTFEKEQIIKNQRHNEQLRAEMSERKKAEQALLKAERLKAVGELSSGISHNFNNLLQIILGNSQLAVANVEDGDFDAAIANLTEIIDAARFGAGTVKRLQNFALMRPEVRTQEAQLCDLSDIVAQAAEMTKIWWKTMPERMGITIRLHRSLEPDCMVRARESELFEVIVNLIKNAAEALPQGGEIRVDTSVHDEEVVCTVGDTGIGISSENLSQVFEPFFTTKGSRSAGMGLASSASLIRGHGGMLSVQSDPGEGATFTIRLPHAGEVSEERSQCDAPAFAAGLHILLIDDFDPVLTMLSEGLRKLGHTVAAACSGIEGLDLFQKLRPDVVISDLGMPGINGWEVGRRISELCAGNGLPRPAFILLTGWAHQAESGQMVESAVDVVVEKPVDVATLSKIVRSVLSDRMGESR